MANDQNSQRPKIQSHGYNGSEPTRICPKCKQEKPLSEFEISHGARTVDHLTKPCWLVKEKWTP